MRGYIALSKTAELFSKPGSYIDSDNNPTGEHGMTVDGKGCCWHDKRAVKFTLVGAILFHSDNNMDRFAAFDALASAIGSDWSDREDAVSTWEVRRCRTQSSVVELLNEAMKDYQP